MTVVVKKALVEVTTPVLCVYGSSKQKPSEISCVGAMYFMNFEALRGDLDIEVNGKFHNNEQNDTIDFSLENYIQLT